MNYTIAQPRSDRQNTPQSPSQQLQRYAHSPDTVVLAIPSPDTAIAAQIAKDLHLPLEECLVRKLSIQQHTTITIGAVAANRTMVLNYDVINHAGISQANIDAIAITALQDFLGQSRTNPSPRLNLKGKTIILVDDGIETGTSVRATIAQIAFQKPAKVILAAPGLTPTARKNLKALVDEFIDLNLTQAIDDVQPWNQRFMHDHNTPVSQHRQRINRQSATPKLAQV
ncbi:hypothetical protein IQ266_27265 [filamentous cyanobacterium LEGE 11480]|uniref:Phosphoribosyltransferase domain-containing protein n=1 Tax=Romeriopsis navalis LEGE 11480 TaxID=2777977 RepID=A0A928VS14_9CYAN|nr:phosphoribosyltransferase family protein [Romeriopsis navalis]MBE9033435.1 hypothetical protein [Romeriopsis navalis LEGE 11480]